MAGVKGRTEVCPVVDGQAGGGEETLLDLEVLEGFLGEERREGGREGGREGRKEGGREAGRERGRGGRKGGRGGMKGGREGKREGREEGGGEKSSERGREGGSEGARERGRYMHELAMPPSLFTRLTFKAASMESLLSLLRFFSRAFQIPSFSSNSCSAHRAKYASHGNSLTF